ncbi:MAG: DUF2341 domain-containing protein [Candidatus Thorarchaeota archaeon]|jgi:uncharacterized repeat protein (TIGR01451 family)
MHNREVFTTLVLLMLVVSVPAMMLQIVDDTPQFFDHKMDYPEHKYTPAQWLSGYDYRKSHAITGESSVGTNYQVKVIVHYGSGTDSGENVYLDSHCQTDFDDIRFASSDETTLLDYWREVYTNGDQAVFWVEISENLDSTKSIFIYYGNVGASSASDGDATFIFFDDFSSGTISWAERWASNDQGAFSVESGTVRCDVSPSDADFLRTLNSYGESNRIHYKVRNEGSNHAMYTHYSDNSGFMDETVVNANCKFVSADKSGADGTLAYFDDTSVAGSPNFEAQTVDWAPTSWATIILAVDGSYVSLSARQLETEWTLNGTNAKSGYNRYLKFLCGSSDIFIDDVFIAKYTQNEPVHSTWGVEESQSGQTTPSTATTTPTAAIDSMMLIASFGGVGIIGLIAAFVIIRSRRKSKLRSELTTQILDEKPPPRVPREVSTQQTMTPQSAEALRAILAAAATPRMIERKVPARKPGGPIQVATGFDAAGENLKLAVKVNNTGEFIVTNVQVILDVPDGFDYVKGTSSSQNLGNIAGGGFQSAIFWLRPKRCVDGEYSGTIIYKDAKNQRVTLEIPPKRLVNVCPMLTATESADEVFSRLKSGSLARNCASFEFSGGARSVLKMAEARLRGLTPVDQTETEYEDGTYLGYSCYVGQTKYGESQFASEIQVSGIPSGGVLTLTVYSDDERILSGFFVDVMHDVRKHVEILEEKVCPVATCSKCGGNLDLSEVGDDRVYRCNYCGAIGKVPPWLE